MHITRTMQIARALAGNCPVIYNDRLVDGRRSLKVPRWRRADYERCKLALEREGLGVVLVEREAPATYFRPAHTQWRLHVSGE